MSLGQVMVGVRGLALQPQEREMLAHPQVGGVILFSRNFEDRGQLQALVAEIHALREPRLVVAIDQEGGRVQRCRQEFTHLPPVGELGKVHERDPRRARRLAEETGFLMAAELRGVGIDISFAPVLDLDRGVSEVIGDRAFHKDPETVAVLAQCYVRGMRRAGMAATGKHFPGHGSVAPDSHLELPRDGRAREAIMREDLLPFERLTQAGIAALMTAHVVYPAIDELPASFSSRWVQDVLRGQLQFDGVVFSDDLGMHAANVIGDFSERARAALRAGCDMVLVCNEFEQMAAVLEGLPAVDPVAAMRVARLQGQDAPDWERLRASQQWQSAYDSVQSYFPSEYCGR